MTGWRVDPAGVNRVLTDTNTAVGEVQKALGEAADSLDEVQEGAGYDGIVSSAYSGFMQEIFDGSITRMFGAYATALEGTANAANAYLAGDEEMATTIAAGLTGSDFGSALFAPPAAAGGGAGGDG